MSPAVSNSSLSSSSHLSATSLPSQPVSPLRIENRIIAQHEATQQQQSPSHTQQYQLQQEQQWAAEKQIMEISSTEHAAKERQWNVEKLTMQRQLDVLMLVTEMGEGGWTTKQTNRSCFHTLFCCSKTHCGCSLHTCKPRTCCAEISDQYGTRQDPSGFKLIFCLNCMEWSVEW